MKNKFTFGEVMNVCSKTDHTNLKKTAKREDIKDLCEEASYVGAASVCVAPCYVSYASELLKNSPVKVCTVIGFPNGYSTSKIKCFEAMDAIENGAEEIDMVLNVGWLKDKRYKDVEHEISRMSELCHKNNVLLKVIVETCLLTKKEIQEVCELCIIGNADYIKTSTGFDKEGANAEDIKLMKETIGNRNLKIKASGGISNTQDAINMINAGADRLGSSKIVSIGYSVAKFHEENNRENCER